MSRGVDDTLTANSVYGRQHRSNTHVVASNWKNCQRYDVIKNNKYIVVARDQSDREITNEGYANCFMTVNGYRSVERYAKTLGVVPKGLCRVCPLAIICFSHHYRCVFLF